MGKSNAWELVRRDDNFPPLRSQENVEDPMVVAKFFLPSGNFTWYVTEYDGANEFFGLVVGFEVELGPFYKSELESVRVKFLWGYLRVERDLYFEPKPLSEIRRQLEQG